MWHAITAFRLVTAQPDRLARFYAALGFAVGEPVPIPAAEMALLGIEGLGERLSLTLGEQRIDLDRFGVGSRPYPADATAADTVFQHFALVTGDVGADWQRALGAGGVPIGDGGPVTLPPASGGATAVKFRDPDGHPLELIQFPDAADAPRVVRIDHSAIGVADAEASVRFYADRGLTEGNRMLNRGETQIRLDGLADVVVDVMPLLPKRRPPHLELLAYRHPRGRADPPAVTDIAATRLVWAADRDAVVRDPDGHLHQLTRQD